MVLREEADVRQGCRGLLARGDAADAHLAGGGLEQADAEVQQRGLAGAVRADERRDASSGDGERTVAQGPGVTVAFAEVVGFECVGGGFAVTRAAVVLMLLPPVGADQCVGPQMLLFGLIVPTFGARRAA